MTSSACPLSLGGENHDDPPKAKGIPWHERQGPDLGRTNRGQGPGLVHESPAWPLTFHAQEGV